MDIGWLIAVLLSFGLGGVIGRTAAAPRLAPGVAVEPDTGVTFDDLGGVEEAKAELQEVVEFLQHPDQYGRLGARGPGGILVSGPAGSGKTLLARALAGEAGVPLTSIRPGAGADATEAAVLRASGEGAVIFIDALEAFTRDEASLQGLLAAMDRLDRAAGHVILGATARPDRLDPALLRPGRFDMRLALGLPDEAERARVLAVQARRVKLDPGLDLGEVAARTAGFSRADLAGLVDEAARLATRRHGEAVTASDLAAALARIVPAGRGAPAQA